MPLDDLGEVALRFGGRIFIWIFVEIIFELFCYYLGRCVLFLLTFGQYKPKKVGEEGTFESFVGLATLIVALAAYLVVVNR